MLNGFYHQTIIALLSENSTIFLSMDSKPEPETNQSFQKLLNLFENNSV